MHPASPVAGRGGVGLRPKNVETVAQLHWLIALARQYTYHHENYYCFQVICNYAWFSPRGLRKLEARA